MTPGDTQRELRDLADGLDSGAHYFTDDTVALLRAAADILDHYDAVTDEALAEVDRHIERIVELTDENEQLRRSKT